MSRPLALITGGTSGIGFAISQKLVSSWDLALIYQKNSDRAAEAVRLLLETNLTAKISTYQADLKDYETCSHAYQSIKEKLQATPAAMIHCAGRTKPAFFLASAFPDARLAVDEHLVVAMALAHLVLPDMYRKRNGRIIFLGSLAASSPGDGQSAYAAAKGGLQSFTLSLSKEVFHRGITVSCVAPGFVETPMARETIKKLTDRNPEFKTVHPKDIAEVVNFLCSEEARGLSGDTIRLQTQERPR